CQQNFATPFTF
nr:immunoglobulin light chain junction region [Macaca mulatta]